MGFCWAIFQLLSLGSWVWKRDKIFARIVFSSWMREALWTSYLHVMLRGSTVSFLPRLTGSMSSSDSKQPSENSELPIFTTEEPNFWPNLLFDIFVDFFFLKIVLMATINQLRQIKAISPILFFCTLLTFFLIWLIFSNTIYKLILMILRYNTIK